MATALTLQEQEDVEDFVREVKKHLNLSRQKNDPIDKEIHYEIAKGYVPHLRKMGFPERIVLAVEERLKPPPAAEPAKPPEGGRKTRKGIKKRRSTRRKFLKK